LFIYVAINLVLVNKDDYISHMRRNIQSRRYRLLLLLTQKKLHKKLLRCKDSFIALCCVSHRLEI